MAITVLYCLPAYACLPVLQVIDECHHCDLNHPYNKILGYYTAVARTKVVGFSASPVSHTNQVGGQQGG